jgi:protein SCO1/2
MDKGRVAVRVGALAATLSLIFAVRALRSRPPLPVYGRVPDFHLVDERGRPFTTASMLGHASVVDFIFTHCTASCPRLTARMAELQARLAAAGSKTQLVSISVDPENDTPPVLARYAADTHADPERWSFVTGAADDVEKAVVAGFKVAASRVAKGANESEVIHGDWFVLVDDKGDVRGYYPTGTTEEMEALWRDTRRVEGGAS